MTGNVVIMRCWGLFLLLALFHPLVLCENLTPPYFNLAEGKEIVATATCGVNTTVPELYCQLVGANSDQNEDINLIQGQVCDFCDPSNPEKFHPPEHAVDGSPTWWLSPPLSRSMKYNEVNLTINLGQEFHVAYIYVRMGNSPRPRLWSLLKSKDYGKTWSPWQYFADSDNDCLTFFGVDSHTPITRDDSVICTTEYSQIVPLEDGEIPISILNNRPSAKHYFNSTLLQEWTRATNVRFHFKGTKNLLGHLMSVARGDPTVTRRYFYSIKDISIGGRCMCNGHADTCDIQDPSQPKKLVCRCQHNTHGPQCASCLPGFQQKKWQQSTTFKKFTCEPCNCFGHSTECIYDPETDEKHLSLDIHGRYEGGGICQNCSHNTEGINCNRCKPRFYRPEGKPLNATDVCQPCNCDHSSSTGNCAESTGRCECRPEFAEPNCTSCSYGYFGYPNCRPCECKLEGMESYHCQAIGGSCPCKKNFGGYYCDLCAVGYYKYPECLACNCNAVGSLDDNCNVLTGNCTCKNNFGGRSCDTCEHGYYNYPSCTYCECDARGTEASVCDKENGRCLCKEGYGGKRCDQCVNGYYGYPNCIPCNCSLIGSSSISCEATGKCSCLDNFAGRTCDECSPGYYKYPECVACNCESPGSIGVSCNSEGVCQCHDNFHGERCDRCKQGFYNYPRCEGCNCDPSGVVKSFTGCGSLPAGELCQCKERVEGRICNLCKPLYWNLLASNPEGCEDCNCNLPGTIGNIAECDSKNGQCICKHGVTDRACSKCVDGTFNLQESNLFGCEVCGCDIGGSISNVCDKESGQCSCQPRVDGLTCKEPLEAHYFPTLHQFQYEVEDGRTPEGEAVRYGFEEKQFPGYSWKGYAVFGILQPEVIQRVNIHQPSVYRMVLRFVNLNSEPVVADIVITPDNYQELEQKFKVQFKPSVEPAFVTVAGVHGNHPSPFVMNPGSWSVSIMMEKSLLLDYFVLLPSEYYEATLLTEDVSVPCQIREKGLCRHFDYPNLQNFDSVHGTDGFVDNGGIQLPLVEYLTDYAVITEFNKLEIPLINREQPEISFNLKINDPGPRVLLVSYVTPKNQESFSTLDIQEASSLQKYTATLYPCKYTSMCRQVVTDRVGKVAVINFSEYYTTLVLRGAPGSNVAIDSVTAIPYEQFSLDYVQPKSVCVKKDGKCVQGMFPGAADAQKIEFETGYEGQQDARRPPGIYDNNTMLVHLNDNSSRVEVTTKLAQPGEYVLVVRYYQPDHPSFNLPVIVEEAKDEEDGRIFEAVLPVDHCPSNSGCRSAIRLPDSSNRFTLSDNPGLIFTTDPGTGIWLDYVLIVPAEQYTEKLLKKIQFDQTKEFIKRCGNNHFHQNTTDEGFCKDSVFSLTMHYNSGALPCHCVLDGTNSFKCEKYGGQCPCKDNIIGRRCETCKTGYYGYPDCKPCSCPRTAVCEPETGACRCPSRVIGAQCDQCEPGTYGFHPIIGCQECKCSPLGVLNGELQCDQFHGHCKCKNNVVGRTCDKCRAGYSQFPYCEQCDCDARGTTDKICDQDTAECYCKENVQGSACDVCKDGTFNIQADNEEGCSKCFCFGKTTRCASANLYRVYTTDMYDWEVVHVDEKSGNVTVVQTSPEQRNESTIVVDFTNSIADNKIIYLSAPESFLGKKLTSYGGTLNYTIHYSNSPFGKAVSGADVILYGAGSFLVYYNLEQPPSFTHFTSSLNLVESNLLTATNLQVTREQLLTVLEDLRGIYIRATYWEPSIQATLSEVILEEATDSYSYNSVPVHSVEQCQCPPNYQGLSCEECAPGYYRVESGPNGGYCVKCQCNGHADTCDVETGVCHDCKNGTTGDYCEFCEKGYYGNATLGTPSDCLICACPLPTVLNNFATGCEVNDVGDKIRCECMTGYWGLRCESCAAGYYGDPNTEGDYCKPCECSGNIDTKEVGSCDSVTGECRHCLNNTYGDACNLCKPGFFGDAVELKNCQSCLCDSCGMERCDNSNGVCECRKNVVGEKCDRCEVNHWGFKTCKGCEACDCHLASESSQCDETTGQCRCKPGVTGRKCDRCIAGFWNYGPQGCVSCGCNTGYSIGASCDTQTGQCSCLPGVIGEKCDHCPYRYVLKEGDGCYKCDSCVHDLLDVTDELAYSLSPVSREFNTVAESYFTNQRLKFINDSVNELEPEVRLLDPTKVDFRPLQTKIKSLNDEIESQKRRVEYTADDSVKWKDGAEKTLDDMNDLEREVVGEIKLVNTVVAEVEALATSIESGTGSKVESSLKQARAILKQIQDVSFTGFRDAASDQLGQANIIVSEMMEYNEPVSNLSSAAANLTEKAKDAKRKVDDLFTLTDKAGELAKVAENLVSENKRAMEFVNFDVVKNSTGEAREDIAAGVELNKKAAEETKEAKARIAELGYNEIDTAVERLKGTIEKKDQELLEGESLVERALLHADSLYNQSLELDDLLTDTRNTSAVRAVSAYRDVEETIRRARENARAAVQAANNATILSEGIEQRTKSARADCENLLEAANRVARETKGRLGEDLKQAEEEAAAVDDQNKKSEESLKYQERILNGLQAPDTSVIEESIKEARKYDDLSKESEDVKGILERILEDVERTKQLAKGMADAFRDSSQVNKQLDSVQRVVPNITELLDKCGDKQRRIGDSRNELQRKIDECNRKVANAREVADKIQVGLNFHRNTTLELKNPGNLPLLATATKISVYVKTAKTNGFLLYLGNEKSSQPRAKTQDFVALMIESGYPVLVVDLGSGPEKLISRHFVSDNVWRQIIIDRTGKNVKLIVREEVSEGKIKEYVTEQALPGTYAIFNLDKDQSKLFVGGYPSSFQMQDAVTASSFEGKMEGLVVGDRPVSLWNFRHGENNNEIANDRDKLLEFATTSSYRFDRNGYMKMSMKAVGIQWKPDKFWITLKFKTFAEDGLIYLTSRGAQFMSLEMQNGRVIYQFDLGHGEHQLKSKDKFNDGEWHTVEARRLDNIGVLTIDDVLVAKGGGSGKNSPFQATDLFYIGGYPFENHPYRTVTRTGFDGCIDNVVILETTIDMSRNLHAMGVTPGCPVRFESLVSFEEKTPGYVRWTNVTAEKQLQINLKFKTQASNGLIFYAANPDQTANSLLWLVDGHLVFKSQGEELGTSSAGKRFNNNEWHVVTATHNENLLRLDIDDTDHYVSEYSPPPLNILNGNLYIGGMPNADQGGSQSTTPFVGCIGDTTLNGAIINFASTKERPNAFLGKCSGRDQPSLPAWEPVTENWPPPTITEPYEVDTTQIPSQPKPVDVDDTEEANTIGNIPLEGRPRIPPTMAPPTTPETQTTTPVHVDQCRLPYYPTPDTNFKDTWRFGTVRNSRFEYQSLQGLPQQRLEFQIDFQTLADEGVLFYAGSVYEGTPDFLAVYLEEGRVNFKFDCSTGAATVSSLEKVNDNQWHSVVFRLEGNRGELSVGDEPPVTGYALGESRSINLDSPLFVGGLRADIAKQVQERVGTNKTFSGCVSPLSLNSQLLDEPTEKVGVLPCSKHVEPGLFFYPGNGSNLFKAKDKFTVGRTMDINLDIKPRSSSGHLLSIHGRRDYLLVEMVNGTIKFLIKANRGLIHTSFEPTTPNSLCDGNWHNIRAIKQRYVVLLSVDHESSVPGVGLKNSGGVMTKHPIFIGGHPFLSTKLRGSTSHAQYVGCIRNIMINGKPIDLDPQRAYGKVVTGVCPTT